MSRFILITLPCLLLVSCDKQGSSQASNDGAAPVRKFSLRSHVSTHEQVRISSKTPREILAEIDVLPPTEREKELAAIAWDAIETDPEIAHEAFAKMAAGSPEKIRLIQHYAMRLASQNIDEVVEWAESLESETEKSATLSHIAIAIAETDPERAANLLFEADIPGRDFEVAVVQVIQRWAAQSPAEAAAWVSQFPQSPAREASVKIIAERWLPLDAPAAYEWLGGIKDPVLRQETARAMEGVILQQSVETRTAWLQHADAQLQIELEKQREQAMLDVGNNILSNDL